MLVAKMYTLYLQRTGYEVLPSVNDGNMAVEKCREMQPDVIVMDVNLRNNTNGYNAARAIREFSEVPVIFTTGNSTSDAEQQSAGIKNTFVLIKPVEPTEVDRMIRKIFQS